ncbi:PilZ domain-containing protein [Halorhodospira halophila]|uniref:PilZ domain-containing protein n=1 Tax=Halorhodospira halophila TaxID=1053 RepID=UPI0019122ECC|nr:PilZ domain-containing protein [Halorhodospira halophila]MBK5943843.1 hypothetical protein [Halorhodospira halophila]
MSHIKVAEELADFWWPLLKEQPWDRWPGSLEEIHEQIYQDVATISSYRSLSRLLIAELIDRAGAPPVKNRAQATIYTQSATPRHRELLIGTPYLDILYPSERPSRPDASPQQPASTATSERRRLPRHRVRAQGSLHAHQTEIPCEIRDLSRLGAQIRVEQPERIGRPLAPRDIVRIRMSGRRPRPARVAYVGQKAYGLEFIGPPT